jgi:hypothetical protein
LAKEYGSFLTLQHDLSKIPGSPLVYWVNEKTFDIFQKGKPLGSHADVKRGMTTSDNSQFLRYWPEVSNIKSNRVSKSHSEARISGAKWFPYSKGGGYRKWYGYLEFYINWEDDGRDVIEFAKTINKSYTRTIVNIPYYFKPSVGFSYVTAGPFSVRMIPEGCLYDSGGPGIFAEKKTRNEIIACMNSVPAIFLLGLLNPTVNLQIADVVRLPLPIFHEADHVEYVPLTIEKLLEIGKNDWDSYETSWDFTSLPLLRPDYRQPTLKATYQKLRAHWREMTLEMQRLEEENNRIFIAAYGLQDELKPEVPLNEITLTCNPHYRYGNDKSENELEALLLADTMRELVSYAVGCMFGRYALDKPGLILANQGETIEDYLKRVLEPSFPADDDNVIPMLDGDWFTDDIVERFRKFLRVAFGEEHYEENLRFVEQALNIKGKRNYSIRDYFLGEFYTDHVKRYKKRPIYWLFSSPKGSFNALIYMHRYRPDTVSVVLNDYLREFRTKLTSHKNHLEAVSISASSSQVEKTKALKEIEKITKLIAEMEEYEREVLYPLATEQVELDLDDGVKVNYPKLGAALKKIVGLEAREEN